MKFIEKEISGKGNTRYMFAIGRSEAFILQKLLEKACKYMPRTMRTSSTEARMKNMLKRIGEAIPRMKNMPPGDYPEFL